MGHQDLCIHQRIRHLGGSCRTVKGDALGRAVPNDLNDEREPLGPAKVAHVAARLSNMKWITMDLLTCGSGTEKINQGQWQRNLPQDRGRLAQCYGPSLSSDEAAKMTLTYIGVACH